MAKKTQTIFDRGEFIAWDGEGMDTGRLIEDAREHVFTLLANSEGDSITNPKGIRTMDALAFLCDVGKAHPRAIHVLFAGNYDCNCILRDIDRESLILLIPEKGEPRSKILIKTRRGHFRVQWIPRKSLSVWRIATDENGRRISAWKGGRRVPVIDGHITLWDAHGFFQGSFLEALGKWLPNFPEMDIIKRGKAARGNFDQWAAEDIESYNAAELRALVQLMHRLRDALIDLELSIKRWDGAGAVAAAMLARHGMKDYLPQPSPEVERAGAFAYFGGRIERGQFGTARDVHAYDINSAYPAALVELPNLAAGEWQHWTWPEGITAAEAAELLPRFSVCRVSWRYAPGARYYPLPFRLHDGRVYFPNSGGGWYWMPEVQSAARFDDLMQAGQVQSESVGAWVTEAWAFEEHEPDARPWSWVRDYYEQRRALVAAGQVGGAELMIKLGLNSLYGKTAQTAGYNPGDDRRPPYHSILCAGYVTSTTRAQLFDAVMTDPDAVIMLATDGVFSARPLPLTVPADKVLGAWGVTRYAEVVAVASGVYFTSKDGRDWVSMCRGYDRTREPAEIAARLAAVRAGWRKGQDAITWPSTRFVGGGTAKTSDLQFKRWCAWYEARTETGERGRAVQLIPWELKRRYTGPRRHRAASRLVWTDANVGLGMDAVSAPYFLPWDVVQTEEEIRELEDMES